ncbi:MAG: YraN family protein [Candidatus Omnitrophica bacterium]|nr:YraN family protein [Candidatus Omnitrophota bacterium]
MPDKHRKKIGILGEKLALKFLQKQGYKIVARNFYCRSGEIDIIAEYKKATIFIEVKARKSLKFGTPEESITSKKIKHMLRTAQFYIAKYKPRQEFFRFDVVTIILDKKPQIRHIKNAF